MVSTVLGRKNVLTTGEVARLCNVAPRTVSKWFDSGQLRGYRIPGSKDRRIPVEHLIRFMRAHGIPLNGLDSGVRRLLILDNDTALWDAAANAMERTGRYELHTTVTAFEAGMIAYELKPHVMIINVELPDVISTSIALRARAMNELQGTGIIGIGRDLSEAQGQGLLQSGFGGYLRKPFDTGALTSLIERLGT